MDATTSELPPHLGGQWAGTIDTGIVRAIRDDLGVRTLVDVGCGDGVATSAYAALGLEVLGIDGDWTKLPSDDHRFICHDFTVGPLDVSAFDLAYSVEFLEHLEERYLDNLRPIFMHCDYAVVTAALPGQEGHHHVNCREPEYWQRVFAQWGFEYDPGYTVRLKAASNMRKASGPRAGRRMKFFQRAGMFFRRV